MARYHRARGLVRAAQGRRSAGRSGKRCAAKGQVGRLPADRPPGRRHQFGRIAVAGNGRRHESQPGHLDGRGVLGRARHASTGRWPAGSTSSVSTARGWPSAGPHHDEHARLLGEYRARDQKMPLAVVIGGDPAFLLAAAAPLPPGDDVCAVAGVLHGKSLDVVACRGVDLDVPAEAEIVLEGYCRSFAASGRWPGRICGPTGHCTSTTARAGDAGHGRDASGQSDLRDDGARPAAARSLSRSIGPCSGCFCSLARLVMPELVDYDLPQFAAARHWAAVSIRKSIRHKAAARPMRPGVCRR